MPKPKTLSKLISKVYDRMVVRKKQEIMFWVLYSFFFIFIAARITVYLFPNLFLSIKGTHVHHFAYGFIVLAIAGLAALNNLHHKRPRLVAIAYGWGLGWAVDEFGMWIHLEDNYWMRRSYDAVFIVGSFLFSLLYFNRFWKALFFATERFFVRRTQKFIPKKLTLLKDSSE